MEQAGQRANVTGRGAACFRAEARNIQQNGVLISLQVETAAPVFGRLAMILGEGLFVRGFKD